LATAYEWHAAGPTAPRLAITNNLASRSPPPAHFPPRLRPRVAAARPPLHCCGQARLRRRSSPSLLHLRQIALASNPPLSALPFAPLATIIVLASGRILGGSFLPPLAKALLATAGAHRGRANPMRTSSRRTVAGNGMHAVAMRRCSPVCVAPPP
jgi:hypothetical protein